MGVASSSGASAPFARGVPEAGVWRCGRFELELCQRPRVMGIVNATPDSFAHMERPPQGNSALSRAAIARAHNLLAEGADLLDIGGESTRPGASPVSTDDELARVLPVVRAAVHWNVPVSVDTSSAPVMAAALDAGVDAINDVRALRRDGAIAALQAYPQAGVVLMHMQGEPATMQQHAHYDDVVQAVLAFWRERLLALQQAGIGACRMVLDPGIGFAKTPEHNLQLLQRQRELLAPGRPLLLGWSRKSTLGVLTGRAVGERLPASLAAALAAVAAGASIVRVHDVAATVDALKVWRAAQPALVAAGGPGAPFHNP